MNMRPRYADVVCLALRFLGYFAALFLLACSRWIDVTFGDPTLQQLIYHLHFADSLVNAADDAFMLDFIGECLVKPALAAFVVFALDRFLVARWKRPTDELRAPAKAARTLVTYCPILVLTIAVFVLAFQFSVFAYAKARLAGHDQFADEYVDPRGVRVEPAAPKNLILIYVESLEAAYADPSLFGKDLLSPLNEVPGTTFGTFRSAPGVGWTMAGLVATQCGVPLRFVTRMPRLDESGNDSARLVQSFMPNAVCLGDLLRAQGYRNVFVGGANLEFAGKGKFLRSHGYDQAYGLVEWRSEGVPVGDVNGWGLYDDELFELAKRKVESLHRSGERFNLTLLTLDTHHPDGHYSPRCRARGAKRFEDIVSCTAEQVVDFYAFLRDGGYLSDTNVVVIGDHLAMPNPVYETLQRVSDRRIFNKFISGAPQVKNTEELRPFDMLPTILEFAGFSVHGDCLGLGCSGFGARERASTQPRPVLSPAAFDYSPAYERLWIENP